MSELLQVHCAVVGVNVDDGNAASIAAELLQRTQHRGEDASNIATPNADHGIDVIGGLGKVAAVYEPAELALISSNLATGHNRWATSGKGVHTQPIEPFGLAHNGTLSNMDGLDRFLGSRGQSIGDANDSEKMSMALGWFARNRELPDAVAKTFPLLIGGFACVAMQGDIMVAFRDGIRPLSIGELDTGNFVFASETCALKAVGADFVRDVKPGEMVVAAGGQLESHQLAPPHDMLDIFEPVYLAHPNSDFYGQSVARTRWNLGRELAKEHPPIDADNVLVMGVPDSATLIAQGYVEALKYTDHPPTAGSAIIRDRYASGRAFIQATGAQRRALAGKKHTPLEDLIRGNHLVVIDDSIVRGDTQGVLSAKLKAAGAESVTVLSASPPLVYPDFYGVATPSQAELIAANLTVEQMREKFGVDYLGYLSLDGMVAATGQPAEKFNLSGFTGIYPVDIGKNRQNIYEPVSRFDKDLWSAAA